MLAVARGFVAPRLKPFLTSVIEGGSSDAQGGAQLVERHSHIVNGRSVVAAITPDGRSW
jgi:hypothetical protein